MDEEEQRLTDSNLEESQQAISNTAGKAGNAVGNKAAEIGKRAGSNIVAGAKEKITGQPQERKKLIVGPDKKIKGKMYGARGQAEMAAGKSAEAAGAATEAAGMATQAAGLTARGTAAAMKGLGAALGAIPYVGAALKAGMDAAAKGTDAAGKQAVKAGKEIKQTGNKIRKYGQSISEEGEHDIKRGAKLANDGVDIGAAKSKAKGLGNIAMPGSVGIPSIPSPSGLGSKLKKQLLNFKSILKSNPKLKWTIIIVSAAVLLIFVLIFFISSKVGRGKREDGDNRNVPYVVSKYAFDNLEILPDGSGGYTYGYVDEDGNALSLDETLDKILETLKNSGSTSLSDLGSTDKERKEFLKLLIQAEISTQYPDLTISGTGSSPTTASGITVTTTGKDFVVATDAANASTVLDEEGLKKAINNSNLSDQAKQNVLGVIPDLVRLQDTYKVNALFLIAAARIESTCGTNWNYIDPSTHNWLSVKGSDNGGYIDRNGTSWNKYSSYSDACEAWFKLITGSSHYFKNGKYTVKEIAPTYCNAEWGESVCRYMEEFYAYAGASSDRDIAAVSNSSISASPSQSTSNIAQWGWVIQNEYINAYYYEHGLGNITYNSPYVEGYITQDGKNYIVVSNSTGWYVGQGVQLYSNGSWNSFNIDLLRNHGVDISSIQVGSTIDANTVDLVSQEIFEYKKNQIQSQAMDKGLNLSENQIVALVDISYLNESVDVQLDNIAKYGVDSEELANTAGFEAVGENDTPTSRAQVVWKLFHYGKYESISGSPYNPSYFEGSTNSTSSSAGSTSESTNSGTAQSGSIDANGVSITNGGNIDFLNYAIDAHALVREDGFYYGQARDLPVVRGDSVRHIDCSGYVSMALNAYGIRDWQYYPHQLTTGTLTTYGQSNFEVIYQGSASNVSQIPDIQSGDIVMMPGHTQIFYGYTSSGETVWLNCGSNSSIQAMEGSDYGWYATPILYVFRVPGGSGNAYSGSRSSGRNLPVLSNNSDGVQGKIKLKRKDSNGNEYALQYVDEATFDNMISSGNSSVMNYYTLKKGVAGTSTTTPGGATLSGSETKEQIWNFLIDSGLTEEGAAGLMGNLEAESGCKSVRVQNDSSHGNAEQYSADYTQKVDSGAVSESAFVHNGPGGGGYGLAQWTSADRKQNLYTYVKSKNASIGDLQSQLEFLISELQSGYSSVWNVVTTSHNLRECSNIVLHKFERPANQSLSVENKRCSFGQTIYDAYSGTRSAGSSSSSNSSSSNNDSNSNSSNQNGNNESDSSSDNNTNSTDGSNSSSSVTTTASFDNFLFLGDSRYVGIKNELETLGSNVSVCAVSGSTAAQWKSVITNGSGTVIGTNISLPNSASGVSVMLGASSATQITELKENLQNLHSKYPNARIYFNSVYHVGSNYTDANKDDLNANYDILNEEMKSFCNSNSEWAKYIDITDGIHDGNGYLAYPDEEGIHLIDEGKTKLVENIKSKISNNSSSTSESASTSNTGDSSSASDNLCIVVASSDTRIIRSVDTYQYAYTAVWSTNSGTRGNGTRFSATPTGYTTTNTTVTYKATNIDYLPAMKNYTLYFDFLWATYISSGNKNLVKELAQEAIDSTVEITVYSDKQVTQNVTTTAIQPKTVSKLEGSTAYTDYYNGTNTTTTTNEVVASKGCVTIANVWNVEYTNEANTYSEFKSKAKESIREKTEKDDNIMKILKKDGRAAVLDREFYLFERMIEGNSKVEHMPDIFKYYIDMARNVDVSDIDVSIDGILDTGVFDLSSSSSVSTVKVLMYTSISISDEEKEMLYKAVEKICSQFPDDATNTQRKKNVTSVILNRTLSSQFPDNVEDVLNQSGQFPNFSPSDLSSDITISDSTRSAVDGVIQGGDCAKYSVYFNTQSGAQDLDWDSRHKKSLEDSDKAFVYYTDDEIVTELKKYEVSVTAGTTMASDTAQKIVAWAESQVGKSSFYNSHHGRSQISTNYCAAFVECAYYEAGLEYYGGNAKDLPHPNVIQFNEDGTVNYSNIPVGAIIVSKGVPVDGVDYGHVCLYIGNGYVIEAGGATIMKTPIDDSFGGKGHNCSPFIGWGFAVHDQDAAYQQLVVKVGGGGNYSEGYTPNDSDTRYSTGIEGVYVTNGKQYNVYCQGSNGVWGKMPYSMQDYANSACGATSVAIIASATNPSITPIETGKAIYSSIGATYGSRTSAVVAHSSLSGGLNAYGIKHEWRYNATKEDVIAHLQSGMPVIVNVHNTIGDQYYSGHYVTLLGINSQGEIFLGDPAKGGKNTAYFDQSKIFPLPEHGVCFIYY